MCKMKRSKNNKGPGDSRLVFIVLAFLLAGGGSCKRPEKDYDACHDNIDNDKDGLVDCRDDSCRISAKTCPDVGLLDYLDLLREKLAGYRAIAEDLGAFKKEIESLLAREEEFKSKRKRFGLPLMVFLKKHFPESRIEILEGGGSAGVEACALLSSAPDLRMLKRMMEGLETLPLLASPDKLTMGPEGFRLRLGFHAALADEERFGNDDIARWRCDPAHGETIRQLKAEITKFQKALGELASFIKKRRLFLEIETETQRIESIQRAMRQAVELVFEGENPLAHSGELVADDTARDLVRIRVDVRPQGVYDGKAWERRLDPAFASELAVAGSRVRGCLVPVATSLFEAARQGDCERIATFLSTAGDVNAYNPGGKTALHLASLSANPEAIELLIEKGADVHARTRKYITPSYNLTPMFYAASPGVAAVLLRHGARVDVEHAEGWTPLHNAAMLDDADMVRWFLARGIDANVQHVSGYTPLHAASAKKGRSANIRVLLAAGARVDARTRRGTTALHMAALEGDAESVRSLLDKGASVRVRDYKGRTPMHFTGYSGDLASAKLLHDKGASADDMDEAGGTPLMDAIGGRHDKLAAWLIEHDADVGRVDKEGCSAVHVAAFRDDPRMMKLLDKHGADPAGTTKRGVNPLHVAAFLGHRAAAAWLLDRGIDPNIRTQEGFIPLELAIFRTDEAMVRLLMSRDANPENPSALRGNPLHFAAMWWPEGVPILLGNKEHDVDIADPEGNTPLYYALVSKKKEAIVSLLERGADPNRKNKLGHTPMHAAAIMGDTGILQELLGHGGKTDVLDGTGLTPLHCAIRMGNEDVVNMLLDKGASFDLAAGEGWEDVLMPGQAAAKTAGKKKSPSMPVEKLPEILHCARYASGDELQDQVQEMTMSTMANMLGMASSVWDLVSKDVVWKEVEHLPGTGVSPLHLAALLGQDDICALLVARGADIDARTGESETALFLASAEGRVKTVRRLLRLGADRNAADANGRKPIDVAREGKHEEVVTLLQRSGKTGTAQ